VSDDDDGSAKFLWKFYCVMDKRLLKLNLKRERKMMNGSNIERKKIFKEKV
jgi:hypothetical protein